MIAGAKERRLNRRSKIAFFVFLFALCPRISYAAADGAGEALAAVSQLTTETSVDRLSEKLKQEKISEELIPDYEPEMDEEGEPLQEPAFTLRSVTFKGNKIFPSDEFKELYAPYMNQKVRLADMKKIAVAITKKYRLAGYFLSYAGVPTQTIKDGEVTMQIFEGYIDQVNIIFEEKNKNPSPRLFQLVHKLRKDRPLKQNSYERYLLLIRDLYPAAKGYLEPSRKNRDGAASLKIFIPKRQPIEGNIGANNYSNDTVGPWMQNIGLSIAPVWNSEHRILSSFSRGNSFRELWSANLGYQFPVFSEGTMVSINQLVSRSKPRGDIKSFKIKMRDHRTTFSITHPFIRSRDTNMYTGIELAIQNQYRRYGLTEDLYKERSRNLKLFNIISWKDRWQGANFIQLSAIQGLNMLRAKKESSPNLTRQGASADRFYFEGEISRMQRITGPYAAGFYIMGQYAGATLLDIDRYRSNGLPFNGAYPVGALSGDSAIEGKIELNYFNYDIEYVKLFRLFMYFSQMKIWNRHPSSIEHSSESAKGVGVGTQIIMENGISSTLEYGYPFTNPVGNDSMKPQVGLNFNWKF